ncbi:putative lipoprotein [Hyphomonas neptunium ATCC 15444]|uniref:Putative lipoprotein n=2 Tax=Hyphomonas TaxID=85 RepID=Q0C0A1_HYPNA|nr:MULTISPECIES: hypothetical protein [Hyphomonas]ABI77943.1 putative lipoprotein [Hyphomonas neptunium ATCC 15444]KCZ90577.1 putative lipoprotein [Hyphomonas hirschiana VP5]
MTIRNRTHVWAVLAATLALAACGGASDTAGKSNGSKDAAGAEPAASTSPLAAPGEEGAIAVTIEATTQFDAGCMLAPGLTNPSGEQFTLYADIGGRRGEAGTVTALLDGENALTMEITGYTDFGGQIGPTSLSGRCEVLDLVIGNVRCREGVGIEGEIGPCPAPVSFTISENVRSMRVK